MNTWLYPVSDGYVMVDTGYENSYGSVVKQLGKLNIQPEDVVCLFLTHAHDDHAGFLKKWMQNHPHTAVYAQEKAIAGLRRGQNSFEGGCSSWLAYLFCQLMALLGNGEHRYPSLSEAQLAKIIPLGSENLSAAEQRLGGRIFFTPGHTEDSVSLLVDGNLFCGDGAMNGIPSLHRITIWVEDPAAYERSWETMLSSGAKEIYPAHGKPFSPEQLKKNKKWIRRMRLRPLK